ncbi:uncharacterized protein LOC123866154 [Maniola jurtina]|uniref:uncharacterized protein LOC123866154 n=1 Tax=Maniola jurtina TaxID=191418 RepID=UPI001E686F76|nr:uncharacterized protein LOC123866154 [Maniola jurtina]
MHSLQELAEYDEVLNPLPPLISINLRAKLDAEKVSIEDVTHTAHHKKRSIQHHEAKEDQSILKSRPRPLHDLEIIWCPSVLDFEIDDVEILYRLRIWNPCPRSIYLHCCGFWDETCRLGAYWRCYPRTRFLLAPGLPVDIYIKATPRDYSPIPHATIALQLAAAHKRDNVVGYFAVPIRVTFLKYLPPSPRGE